MAYFSLMSGLPEVWFQGAMVLVYMHVVVDGLQSHIADA